MEWVEQQRCKALVELGLLCHSHDSSDWVLEQLHSFAKKTGEIAVAIVRPSNWLPNDKMDYVVGGLFVGGYVLAGLIIMRFGGPPGILLGGAMIAPGPMYGTAFFAGVWVSNVLQEVF